MLRTLASFGTTELRFSLLNMQGGKAQIVRYARHGQPRPCRLDRRHVGGPGAPSRRMPVTKRDRTSPTGRHSAYAIRVVGRYAGRSPAVGWCGAACSHLPTVIGGGHTPNRPRCSRRCQPGRRAICGRAVQIILGAHRPHSHGLRHQPAGATQVMTKTASSGTSRYMALRLACSEVAWTVRQTTFRRMA